VDMNLSLRNFLVAVCILFLLHVSTLAQSSEVTQIRIASSWGGLGTPAHDDLTIVRKGTGYHAGNNRVDAQLIDNLLNALHQPAVPKIDLTNLGITQEWLNANAEKGIREYADDFYSRAAPNLQALYLSTFKDMEFMKRLVPSRYRLRWTDDNPSVEVE